jgi:hypothetical protein
VSHVASSVKQTPTPKPTVAVSRAPATNKPVTRSATPMIVGAPLATGETRQVVSSRKAATALTEKRASSREAVVSAGTKKQTVMLTEVPIRKTPHSPKGGKS